MNSGTKFVQWVELIGSTCLGVAIACAQQNRLYFDVRLGLALAGLISMAGGFVTSDKEGNKPGILGGPFMAIVGYILARNL